MTDFIEERKNRQYMLMLEPAIERLQKYTPEEICQKSGAAWDAANQCISIKSMGTDIVFTYPDFQIQEKLEMWHHLTLLQYMDTADRTSLTDNWIGLSQMRGGLARGRSYERHIDTMFLQEMKNISALQFQEASEALGGKKIESRADISMELLFAPYFPIQINFWEADEEYPSSVKMLVNEMADHYLGIEAAGAACQTVAEHIRAFFLESERY